MTSVDFAAAQQRVLARREARASDAATRDHIHQHQNASTGITKLPFPIGALGERGLAAWAAVKGRNGTSPAFRVGQVDAELLDEELLELLKAQLSDGIKGFGSHLRDDWSSEINLGLRAILFKLSIWDHNTSYGAMLQDLHYTDARHNGLVPIAPSRLQKACHGILSVGGRYGWEKWENWISEQENGIDEPSSNIQFLSRITSHIVNAHSFATFLSFLLFLFNGRYRTLLDRVLRMRLAPSTYQIRREVSFEYLNRQLVWHAFTEFLLFLLPLVGISRWRKWVSRAWHKMRNSLKSHSEMNLDEYPHGELSFLPERTCAICYHDQNPTLTSENEVMTAVGASGGIVGSAQTDVTNPYQSSCGCVYCFVCIATKLESEEGDLWTCLRCGMQVKNCRPWDGDVLDPIFSEKKVASSVHEKTRIVP